MNDTQKQMQTLADKLRQMWGNNPDSQLLEAAIPMIVEPSVAETETEAAPAAKKGKKS